ncbi:hypothetical protein M728_005420 (plasmid) [Ensifer sp. WSM1721]
MLPRLAHWRHPRLAADIRIPDRSPLQHRLNFRACAGSPRKLYVPAKTSQAEIWTSLLATSNARLIVMQYYILISASLVNMKVAA